MLYHKNKYKRSMILDLVERHRYLRRSMIQQMFFNSTCNCNKLLKKMVKHHDLKWFCEAPRTEYIYHTERKSQKWQHWLAINEFHFYFARFAHIVDYRLEYSYKYGIADGLYLVELNGFGLKFFLEVDDGNNDWDKYQKYQRYFMSKNWIEEYWADYFENNIPDFPFLLIITPRRKELDKKLTIANVDYLVFLAENNQEAVRKLIRYSNEDD